MNTTLYAKESELATRVAREVGLFLRDAQQGNNIVKQPHGEGYLDVTTQADLKAEEMVLDAITAAFPEDRILSEETRTEFSKEWNRVWIVDPLDGTTNFVKGLGQYAVSIALWENGAVQVAAAYLPATDQLYSCVRAGGVLLNGEPLPLATPDDSLAKSLVSVGFPHVRSADVAAHAFALYGDLWLAASDLRRSASAVYDATLLAAGITGAYITPDIKPWDIAAVSLFAEEQGGVVSDFSGNPLDLFHTDGDRFSVAIVASKNSQIHETVIARTSKF